MRFAWPFTHPTPFVGFGTKQPRAADAARETGPALTATPCMHRVWGHLIRSK